MRPPDGAIEVVLVARGSVLARWPLVERCADLATVNALARLQIAARRAGASIELQGTRRQLAELGELIELAGLRDILPMAAPDAPDGDG